MNIIILVLLIVIVLFFAMSALEKSYLNKRHMGRNTAKWILGTYCAVLLTSVLLLYLVPNKGFLYLEEGFFDHEKYVARERVDIVSAAQENKLDQTDGISLLGERNFAYQGEELEISFKTGYSNIPVIVKKKEQRDGQIEAAYYTTKTLSNNIDLSDKIKLPQMELIGNQLKLINPENEIKLIKFKKNFLIAQFSDSTSYQPENVMNFEWGQKVLYLQIPHNVQLKSKQLEVQYVGEN